MLLNTRTGEIERSGITTESTFKIKTTAKAFEILSTGLYSNAILAIIRELSSNAYDAHIAAGRSDIPFDVHLPNVLEPFFSIRDYGTGLSNEEIFSLYTTYFESTKTESNDFIGALGLGSKSPFSYVPSFEVISWHEGTQRNYSIFLNEEGIPCVALLGEFPTDQTNGLEVRLAVKRDDFYKFREELAHILKFFPTKPTVKGHVGFQFDALPETKLSGEQWYITHRGYNDPQMVAVQGNVPYKVDLSLVAEALTDNELNAVERFVNKNVQAVLFFNIGELEVAASREAIRYDERTKNNIANRLRQLVVQFMEQLAKTITDITSACNGLWDVTIALDHYSFKTFSDKFFVTNAPWSEQQLASLSPVIVTYIKTRGVIKLPSLRGHKVALFRSRRSRRGNNLTLRRSSIINDPATIDRSMFTNKVTTGSINVRLATVPETVFFYNDVSQNGADRITLKVNQLINNRNKIDSIYIITPLRAKGLHARRGAELTFLAMNQDVTDSDEEKYIDPGPVNINDELAYLLEKIGNPMMFLVSRDTPQSTKVPRHHVRELYQFSGYRTGRRYSKQHAEWNRVRVDLDRETGLYFRLRKGAEIVDHNDNTVGWSASTYEKNFKLMIDLINKYNNTSYTFNDLYGVPHSLLKDAQQHDNWKNIFELFEPIVNQYVDYWYFKRQLDGVTDPWSFKLHIDDNKFTTWVRSLNDDSVFKKTMLPIIEHRSKFAHLNGVDIDTVGHVGNISVRTHSVTDTITITGYHNTLIARYPMLSLTDQYGRISDERMEVIRQYIESIDKWS